MISMADELALLKKEVPFSESDQALEETQEIASTLCPVPIHPAYLVVLTIGIVVPLLRSSDLVTSENHWHALGEDQCRGQVSDLPVSQPLNDGICGRPLNPAIPAVVLVKAVAVPLAVRLVVLLIVAYQVSQSESIVARDEIHAVIRCPPASTVEISAAAEPCRKGSD